MIVYGDPSTLHPADEVLAALRERLAALRRQPAREEDQLRSLLLGCGQVEQAVQDWLAAHPGAPAAEGLGEALQQATDLAAQLFLAVRYGYPVSQDWLPRLAALEARLSGWRLPAEAELAVKLPEGFAFYALFPEQYALAARQWHAAQSGARRPVLVVGVRSAGTTLSAVVAAELSRLGCPLRRITLRPGGHPFAREAELPAAAVEGVGSALVVDEGPGLSGSSMAAVARALAEAGVNAERIAFLPGHGGEPGSAASEEVREWWQQVPRFHCPLEELRWPEGDLGAVLARTTEGLSPDGGPVVEAQDLSWGRWRGCALSREAEWPAAALPLERTKCRYRLAGGRSVLWKFEGLAPVGGWGPSGAERVYARWARLAEGGWTVAPLGTRLGFVAVPWVEGEPCRPEEGSPELLRRIGQYVAAGAGAPLSDAERVRAHGRLRELLYWNTWEALGEELAGVAGAWADRVGPAPEGEPRYGDGRMAPWEWVREAGGRVVKVDTGGHAEDHTAVGAQSVLWDLAGAVVEWNLETPGREALLEGFGRAVDWERLAFYEACYAAFRMGVMQLCVGGAPDEAERGRASKAYGWYRRGLEERLRGV